MEAPTAAEAVQNPEIAVKNPEKPRSVRISTTSCLDKPDEHGLKTRLI
jgi:hypothetical protein